MSVAPVTFAETLTLRRGLRPGATDAELAAHYDGPGAVHLGLRDDAGALVGVATALPAPLPADPAAWRVRGVVTRESLRSRGFGASLMVALLAEVAARDARTVWLTARTRAEPFYARLGFARHGAPYDDPDVGPHVEMRARAGGMPGDGTSEGAGAIAVRPAGAEDAVGIAAVYAESVLTSVASFEEAPPPAAEMLRRMESAPRLPWFVATRAGGAGVVVGYAYAAQHRPRPAYRWSVDVAVYLAGDARGRGTGRRLYAALLPAVTRLGYVTAFAGVSLPNPASVALHEGAGFTPVGVERAVGFRSGGWRDVGWWQLRLAPPPVAPAEPAPWEPSTWRP